MRDDLVEKFSDMFDVFEVNLIESNGGVFEVMVNDTLEVFSKKKIGRHYNSTFEVIKTIDDSVREGRLR